MAQTPKKIQDIYSLIVKNGFHFTTDTRKINAGDVFFALKGENFNGNDYGNAALEKGAVAIVVDDDTRYSDSENTFVVDDVLSALQKVATLHRVSMKVPVLCLTGSNGKTTSKELISRVLSKKYNVCATSGNFNNHVGVPLTLLSIRAEHDFAVVEMGASHLHEIEQLSAIARPDYGYITNFGRAHLEGFGGVEGVIKTKSELYDFLRNNGGTAFVNADDELQIKRSNGVRRFTFSSKNAPADVSVEMTSSLPIVSGKVEGVPFKTHLSGEYNFVNAAAAASVGVYFGVDKKEIADALDSYIPSNNRSQWTEKNGNVVMMDAYNANPTSMGLSVENFAKSDVGGKKKVAVLGDMFELGEYALTEHQNIADAVAYLPYDEVFLIGEMFSNVTVKNHKIKQFRTFEEFSNAFDTQGQKKAYLVKGSRGMAMERFLDLI
ncbi:MAG: UDP-N-acetylmuramoyl-tripeptide--D-alanyl-D-alanine ligase [Flavobacteriales bacterium]|nr:UDP-N-acetylmuramoyl-tripeptide--D-alanyl-D-alanine ligase [Flavobacteriales bacterium]